MFGRIKQRAKQAIGLSGKTSDPEFEELKAEFEKIDAHFMALFEVTKNYLDGVRVMCAKSAEISEALMHLSRCEEIMQFRSMTSNIGNKPFTHKEAGIL